MSAVSDPSLLTQLLTSNNRVTVNLFFKYRSISTDTDNENMFGRNQGAVSSHDQLSKQVRIKEESSPIPILPQPSPAPTALIITTPVNINAVQSPSSDSVSSS
jgi:hypothetical protein